MPPSVENNKRQTVLHIISAAAGLALLFLIGAKTGFAQFLENVSSINPIVFIPLTLVYSVSWLMRGFRLKRILSILNCNTGLFKAMGIELIADLANHFIPAKLGDSVKVVYMRKTGMLSYTSGTFAAFLVRVMDLTAVILLALFSAIFVSGSVTSSYSSYILTISILVVLLVLSAWTFVYHPSLFTKLLIGPLKKIRGSVFFLADRMKENPYQLLTVLLQSMLVWLSDILTLFIFLLIFDIKLTLPETAFVMLLSTIVKILPLTPNGIGLYEGMMVVLLARFGIPESTAFTVALLDHGFMNLFSILLALISLYALGLGFKGTKMLLSFGKDDEEVDDG